MNKNQLSLVVGMSLSVPSLVIASDGTAPEPTVYSRLNTVVVSATKIEADLVDIPQAVSVMTSDDIKELNPASVYEALEWMPGVDADTGNPYLAQPSVRGLSGARVVVNVDGLNQTMDSNKGMELSPLNIDPYLIEQVEVQKGSSSLLYGSGGMGGVIALRTKKVEDLLEPDQSVGGFVRSQYGSVNKDQQNTAGIYGLSESKAFDWMLTGNLYNDKIESSSRNAKNDSHQLTGKFGWNLDDDQRLALKVSDSRREYVSKGLVEPDIANDLLTQVTYDLTRGDHINLKTLMGYSESERKASMAAAGQQDTDVQRWQFDIQNSQYLTAGTADHEVTYGFNTYKVSQEGTVDGRPDSFIKPEGDRHESAVFVQDRMDWSKFTILTGLRYNRYEMTSPDNPEIKETDLLPSLGVTYRATDWLSLHASYSHDFRAPTIDELYTTSTAYPGMEIIANPNLKPETSKNREVGFSLHHGGLLAADDMGTLRATYFDQDIKDMITIEMMGVDPDSNNLIFGSVNKESVNRTGFELETEYRTNQLSLSLSADKIREEDKLTGEIDDLPGMLKTRVGYTLEDTDMTLSWLTRSAQSFKRSGEDYSGYMTHDLRMVWDNPADIKGAELTLALNNVLDKEHHNRYGATGMERNVRVGIAYKM